MTRISDVSASTSPPPSTPDIGDGAAAPLNSPPANEPAAEVRVAAADIGPRADLTVLDLEDLLQLRLDDEGAIARRVPSAGGDEGSRLAAPTAGLAQLIDTADLPADLTSLDLEQVLNLELTGDHLPTVLEVAKLPVDLTVLELAQLLGLKLAGEAVPTIEEVVQLALQTFDDRTQNADSDEAAAAAANGNDDAGDEPVQVAGAPSGDGDISFLDGENLSEQADETTDAADDAAGDNDADDAVGADTPLAGGAAEDDLEVDDGSAGIGGGGNPDAGGAGAGGGGGGGGGTNVINGTPGDDTLVGAGGTDLINGHNGADFIDGGAGSDILHGQNGNDILVWDAADSQITGGNGTDTLQVNGGDADITAFGGTMSGIEVVDLATDAGANTLTLTYADVLSITDNSDTLTILGDALDSLDAGTGWTDAGFDGGGNQIYTQGSGPNTATLIVDPTISVNGDILM